MSSSVVLVTVLAARTGPASATPADRAPTSGSATHGTPVSTMGSGSTTGAALSTSALTASDVWAAGYQQPGDGSVQPLVEHWNGTRWSVTKTRLPADQPDGTLQSVVALAPDDVWAVGYSSAIPDGASRTLAEHWNGRRWKVVSTAEPEGATWSALQSVTAISRNDVWAVGYFYDSGDGGSVVEHWDGSAWTLVSSADPAGAYHASLQSVSALSAKDVWASGFYFDDSGAGLTLTEHWNGRRWELVASPDVDGSPDTELHAVAARSAHDVWASGNAFTGSSYVTVVEHWDGSAWSIVDSPNPPSSSNTYLYGVDALSAKNAWATCYYYSSGAYYTLAEKWNGRTWKIVDTANVDGGSSYLFGVDALSRHDVWAAGFAFTDHDVAFTEHYDRSGWSLSPLR